MLNGEEGRTYQESDAAELINPSNQEGLKGESSTKFSAKLARAAMGARGLVAGISVAVALGGAYAAYNDQYKDRVGEDPASASENYESNVPAFLEKEARVMYLTDKEGFLNVWNSIVAASDLAFGEEQGFMPMITETRTTIDEITGDLIIDIPSSSGSDNFSSIFRYVYHPDGSKSQFIITNAGQEVVLDRFVSETPAYEDAARDRNLFLYNSISLIRATYPDMQIRLPFMFHVEPQEDRGFIQTPEGSAPLSAIFSNEKFVFSYTGPGNRSDPNSYLIAVEYGMIPVLVEDEEGSVFYIILPPYFPKVEDTLYTEDA